MERGKVKKIKFGTDTYHGSSYEDVPLVQLEELEEELFASYSGPDKGLAIVDDKDENNGNEKKIAGCLSWNKKEQQAYGICISLYEQHPINFKMSGDPVADAFAICARKNNTILLIADGVNWGEKSRLAARCALYGSMNFINKRIFEDKKPPLSTQDVLQLLRRSFNEAHRIILEKGGGLTTMCACMICPVANSDEHAVCCVNVGDSFGFVFSHNNGIREVTIGSHDVSSERDIRDAGGALGPVDGKNPELHNLTYSLTFCHAGDVVFLTTDGISDNFDPVVTKIALPRRSNDDNFNNMSSDSPHAAMHAKPEMEPRERHIYSMKEMERVVHEYELITEENCSAQELCGAMVQHVLMLTDEKRKILENPALYARRKMTSTERKRRDSEIVEKMSKAPGKLDHASIVAIEVGAFDPVDEENEENVFPVDNTTTSDCNPVIAGPQTLPLPSPTHATSPLSPTSPNSKKSGPKKFFAKLKNIPSPTLPSPSRSTPSSLQISPRKSRHRWGRSRHESESGVPTSPTVPQSPTIPESPLEAEYDPARHLCSPKTKNKGKEYQRSLSCESAL
ncbi:PP2C-like domain-containing protein CG9801 [Haliotis asinina]|uniref:PP2C-like domain-containing protein CG9801 n=1 Tax=Haliotis asinina TaxID=109174 RepID=UPI003531C76C